MTAIHSGTSKKDMIGTGHLNNTVPQDGEAPLQGRRLCWVRDRCGSRGREVAFSSCVSGLGHCSEHSIGRRTHTWEYYVGWLQFLCVWGQPNVLFQDVEETTSIGSWSGGFTQLLCRATLENNLQEMPEHIHPLSTSLLIMQSLTYLCSISRRRRRAGTTTLCSTEAAAVSVSSSECGRYSTVITRLQSPCRFYMTSVVF